MGTGRNSGLPKGVVDKTAQLKKQLDSLTVKARKQGYWVRTSTVTTLRQAEALEHYFYNLADYQKAMGESGQVMDSVGNIVELHRFIDAGDGGIIAGDCSSDGTIRMNEQYVIQQGLMIDTLPHEHTHALVNYLITKELGFRQGSPEYYKAYNDAVMYQDINNKALINLKTSLNKEIVKTEKLVHQLEGKSNDSFLAKVEIEHYRNELANLRSLKLEYSKISTPFEAAKLSGMRDYAIRDYDFAPSGAGIEIPTVSSEIFCSCNYNWDTLKSVNLYAYYVLQEIKHRLN